jgi:hypothetical protein
LRPGGAEVSVDLDSTRKLRADARKRLTKALCERLPDVIEGMNFYHIADDSYSAYEVMDIGTFRVVLSVKADEKKLRKAGSKA